VNSAAQRVEKNTKEQYVENPQKLLKFIQTWNIKMFWLASMKKNLTLFTLDMSNIQRTFDMMFS
jgi:hypothetical protein